MNLLSLDLNTLRLSNVGYTRLLCQYDLMDAEIHLYNYIEQKHGKLPLEHGETIHPYIGSRKKITLDISQALDIVELCANNTYQCVYIVCGEYQSEFLTAKLDAMHVNYCKIPQCDFRIFASIENADSEESKQLHSAKAKPAANNAVTSQFEVIKDSGNQIEQISVECAADLGNDAPISKKFDTKLTPEQIRKIYTYIKLKQLKSQLTGHNDG